MIRKLVQSLRTWGPRTCPACGRRARLRFSTVMWPELGEEWELPPALYRDMDESRGTRCLRCGTNLQARQLAGAIVRYANERLGTSFPSLDALCRSRESDGLTIAEINSAGDLHQFLARLSSLSYSEYGSRDPAVRSEDLMALSYRDATFDLVITSETLEHLPDFGRGLREIRRILKPAGAHIFTIPVVWERQTRRRASLDGGRLVHHLPPSYHGRSAEEREDFIVFFEFGGDVVEAIAAEGFEVELIRDSRRPSLATFLTRPAGVAPHSPAD